MSDFHELDGLIPGEKPERLKDLHARLEGQQLAWLHLTESDGSPLVMGDGGLAVALEFVTGERWIISACAQVPVRYWDFRFLFRLMWRRIPPQKIETPRSRKYFSQGRDAKLPASVHTSRPSAKMAPEDIQKICEGEIIAGLKIREDPSPAGGERSVLEFRSGWRFAMEAGPPPPPLPGELVTPITADMEYALIPPPRGRRIYAMNGGGLRG